VQQVVDLLKKSCGETKRCGIFQEDPSRTPVQENSIPSMKKSFWQTRTALILAGISMGFVARGILGAPEPDTPAGPAFANPLPDEVPFSVPLPEGFQLSVPASKPEK
jgi:hypothetical protein